MYGLFFLPLLASLLFQALWKSHRMHLTLFPPSSVPIRNMHWIFCNASFLHLLHGIERHGKSFVSSSCWWRRRGVYFWDPGSRMRLWTSWQRQSGAIKQEWYWGFLVVDSPLYHVQTASLLWQIWIFLVSFSLFHCTNFWVAQLRFSLYPARTGFELQQNHNPLHCRTSNLWSLKSPEFSIIVISCHFSWNTW